MAVDCSRLAPGIVPANGAAVATGRGKGSKRREPVYLPALPEHLHCIHVTRRMALAWPRSRYRALALA